MSTTLNPLKSNYRGYDVHLVSLQSQLNGQGAQGCLCCDSRQGNLVELFWSLSEVQI